MSDSAVIQTPDEVVADKIVARLIEAGLISEQDKGRTNQQLAEGKLKAEDWRLLAEKALERETAGDGNNGQ